jgi:hypothetical protein
MARTQLVAGFAFGVFTTLVAVFVLSGGPEVPKAMAQAPPPIGTIDQLPPARELPRPGQPTQPSVREAPRPGAGPVPVPDSLAAMAGRYQVATWAYPATSGPNPGWTSPSFGAYVLDTQNGQVWGIKEGGRPQPLGGVR